MKSLFGNPTVFVIGDDYEITVYTNANGLCFLRIGEEIFYDAVGGIMRSETRVHKFRIPQKILNKAKEYEIIIRGTNLRKAFYSTFNEPESYKYSFKPLEKTENIKAYYLSDVHYSYKRALACASYFGEDTDLYILNGDLGDEISSVEQYREIIEFLSNLAKGEVPVLFVRGNHDTKGNPAERYGEYFPTENGNTYFTFNLGIISGVALDLGEDKDDMHPAYDSSEDVKNLPPELSGINRFHDYRKREAEFLKNIELSGKIRFAVSHIPPVLTELGEYGNRDFELETYTDMSKALGMLDIDFMISGHHHKALLLTPGDERSTAPHTYPVIVGSAVETSPKNLVGTALILNPDKTEVLFTDTSKTVRESFTLKH